MTFQRATVNSNLGVGCLDLPLFIGKKPLLPASLGPSGRTVVIVLKAVELEKRGEEPERPTV